MSATAVRARERRAKIALVVLLGVLVLVCALQAPKLFHHAHAAEPATATTPAAPATPASLVVASAPRAATHVSRLQRFAWKDPFRQQLQPKQQATPPQKQAPAPPKKTTTTVPRQPPTVQASAPPADTRSFTPTPVEPVVVGRPGVLLLLDGRRLGLLRGDLFPAADPAFRLVSFTKKTARVALLGGTLSGGGSVLTLRAGHRLVLTNASTGDRYVLELVRPARVVPPPKA